MRESQAKIMAAQFEYSTKLAQIDAGSLIIQCGILGLSGNEPKSKSVVDIKPSDLKDPNSLSSMLLMASHLEMASVVFAYSVTEAALVSILEIAFSIDPLRVSELFSGKQVSLDVMRSKTQEEIENQLFRSYCESFDHLPIRKKIEKLLSVLKPRTNKNAKKNFTLDLDIIELIAERRHSYIHQKEYNPLKDRNTVMEDVRYLGATVDTMFLFLEQFEPKSK